MPKLSIIIPVYNHEEYLEQCLNSLLAQTYKNLEIVCIDDGSSDNSLNILERYKTLDGRITVISQQNRGQYAARNIGVSHSTGDWITFVDCDDWVDVNCYEEFHKALENNDFEIFMFNGTSFTKNENNSNDVSLQDFFFIENWNKKDGELCTFKDCKNPFEGNLSVYNKIYKREFLEKYNLKFEKSSFLEDELYWIEAFCAAKSIYLCDKRFYFYRQHKNSTMHTLKEKVFDVFPVFEKIKQKLIEYNYFDMAKYAFLQHKFRQFAFFFFTLPSDMREQFFHNAKNDLAYELSHGYNMDILKNLKDNRLLFDFLNLNSNEFFQKYISCVKS
ncbi:MAG: glycosyltransferase [bacterium]|nr:glycosyltransferase [bacterium]